MTNTLKSMSTSNNRKEMSISKNGKDKRVSVRQISNGFIITKTVEGKDKKGEWKYDTQEWYSKEDPLEILDTDKRLSDFFD